MSALSHVLSLVQVPFSDQSLESSSLNVFKTSITCYCFCSFSIVPESPRWLVLQGHVKAACQVLMKFSSNKRSTPTDPDLLRSQLESLHRSETNPHAQSRNVNHSPLDLLRTPRMRKRTLIFWFNW